MKLELTAFRTKVARRMFLLFILCAVVPTSALAVVSYALVKRQLNEQSRELLIQESKSVEVSITERLGLLKSEMHIVANLLNATQRPSAGHLTEELAARLGERFKGIFIQEERTTPVSLFGGPGRLLELNHEQMDHLRAGKALLMRSPQADLQSPFYLIVAAEPQSPEHRILIGDIDASFLWQAAVGRAPSTDVLIMENRTRSILFNSFSKSSVSLIPGLQDKDFSHSGLFEWEENGRPYFANYRSYDMATHFLYDGWVIILTEAGEDIFAPMANFRFVFPMIMVLTLGFVFLLSINQIRRSTVPIDKLRIGTQRIAQGDLGYTVHISSNDEFKNLGESFNLMSSKLRESQEMIVQAAKMSTMGQMVAGIIHEIKQPLTAISGLVQLSLLEDPQGEERERLETMGQAVERLDGILQKFRGFSIKSEEKFKPLSLKWVIEQVYQLMKHQLSIKRIRCVIEQENALPYIIGDNQGLQQVMSNLLINAMDALEEKEEGDRIITIKTHALEGTVYLRIRDNGCGITQEALSHVFDPFFTTKGPEKGTGLGLAIIDTIIHKHHAKITVKSDVGVGTEFIIAFPAVSNHNPTEDYAFPGVQSETSGLQVETAETRETV
ncbi:MAG: sensor histidine kinase [Desulfatiglandales bacterium]